jgi:hypothetical protein
VREAGGGCAWGWAHVSGASGLHAGVGYTWRWGTHSRFVASLVGGRVGWFMS